MSAWVRLLTIPCCWGGGGSENGKGVPEPATLRKASNGAPCGGHDHLASPAPPPAGEVNRATHSCAAWQQPFQELLPGFLAHHARSLQGESSMLLDPQVRSDPPARQASVRVSGRHVLLSLCCGAGGRVKVGQAAGHHLPRRSKTWKTGSHPGQISKYVPGSSDCTSLDSPAGADEFS